MTSTPTPTWRAHALLAALIVAAVAIAWSIRFGTDDAFISFNYARSLVRGDGLTWFGEHVEGYTNFAWVLWIAGGFVLGAEPLAWAWAGSLAALAVALFISFRWAWLRTASAATALGVVGLLATNFTFLAFGTSGLETMLQCALLTTATCEVDRLRRGTTVRVLRLATLSLVCALALWTRLDSAVVLLVLGVVTLSTFVRQRASVKAYAAVTLPALVLVGGWLAWKLHYYGELLPNTFHAKVETSSATMWAAAKFCGAFLHAYTLWPVLVLVVVVAFMQRSFTAKLPLAIVATWFAYVVLVGGDFMEFRFFVPILPPLFVLLAETLTAAVRASRVPSSRVRAAALVAVLASLSWRHAATFEHAPDQYLDSIRRMATFYGMVRDNDWSKLGTSLRDSLAGSDATLASSGAGALPYYAGLPTVDQLGLNDTWIARHGTRPAPGYLRPGHQRFATHEYLVGRRVTFVIGSPTLIRRGTLGRGLSPLVTGWLGALLGASPLPTSEKLLVVAAPVDDSHALLLWYLTPTPEITERIRQHGWELHVLVPRP